MLERRTPDCSDLIAKVNHGQAGQTFDFRGRFQVRTAPLYPALPAAGIDFTAPSVRRWQRDFGWTPAESWGSWTRDDAARLGFTLPEASCHRAELKFKTHPFVHPSRPQLVVRVLANGKLMTTWHFDQNSPKWPEVSTPIETPDPKCRVDLRFVFSRPGALPPPYPKDEDPRPLQLDFVKGQLVSATASAAGTPKK